MSTNAKKWGGGGGECEDMWYLPLARSKIWTHSRLKPYGNPWRICRVIQIFSVCYKHHCWWGGSVDKTHLNKTARHSTHGVTETIKQIFICICTSNCDWVLQILIFISFLLVSAAHQNVHKYFVNVRFKFLSPFMTEMFLFRYEYIFRIRRSQLMNRTE
jgi:hypothetical protein